MRLWFKSSGFIKPPKPAPKPPALRLIPPHKPPMKQPTPETDNHPSRWEDSYLNAEFIHADFARELERQRDEARAKLKAKLKIVMTHYANDSGSSYEVFKDLSWETID
tara:strand:+ start:63 stop:386 length:324 start_codon:yes stop_codon:yes gene_type:complete